VDVLLLLLGSVVGWLGSISGSVIVGRRELTRTSRIRMYRELLPPLINATLDAKPWSAPPIPRSSIEDLYREGVLAGRQEGALARQAVAAWVEVDAAPTSDGSDEEGNSALSTQGLARWAEANQRLLSRLVALETFVEKKVR